MGQHTCGTGKRSQTSQLRPSQTVHTSGSAKDIYEVPGHALYPHADLLRYGDSIPAQPEDVIDEFLLFSWAHVAESIFGIARKLRGNLTTHSIRLA